MKKITAQMEKNVRSIYEYVNMQNVKSSMLIIAMLWFLLS